jgi:hypothetical protein
MPLTKLDTYGALIMTDLQKSIVGIPTVHPAGEIIGRAAQLARAFRERNLPVVLVNVTGIGDCAGECVNARWKNNLQTSIPPNSR